MKWSEIFKIEMGTKFDREKNKEIYSKQLRSIAYHLFKDDVAAEVLKNITCFKELLEHVSTGSPKTTYADLVSVLTEPEVDRMDVAVGVVEFLENVLQKHAVWAEKEKLKS